MPKWQNFAKSGHTGRTGQYFFFFFCSIPLVLLYHPSSLPWTADRLKHLRLSIYQTLKEAKCHFLLTSRVTRWWNKKLPNFHKNAPKVALHFLHKSDIIISSPRSHQNIWATFYWDNMLPRTCKTGPTWSLCSLVNELELLLKQILLLQDDKFSPKRRSFDWMDAVLTICWSTLPFQEGC